MSKDAEIAKIYIGSDHKGFALKEQIKKWLESWGYNLEDLGAHVLDPQDDYPDFVSAVAKKVSLNNRNTKGIVLGSTGQGEAAVANKYKGVRAVVFYGGPQEIIKLSRSHNDANILSIGASFITNEEAKKALKLWLDTAFSFDRRHIRRIGKINEIEQAGNG